MCAILRTWWLNHTNDIRKGVVLMLGSLGWDVGRELRHRQCLPFASPLSYNVVAHPQGHTQVSTEEA